MAFDLKSFIRKLKILPVLIIVASFGFVVRLGDTYFSLKSMSGSAYAEEVPNPDEKAVEKTADAAGDKAADKTAEKPAVAESPVSEPPKDALKSSDDKDVKLPSTDGADSAKADDKSGDKTDDKDAKNSKWQDASDTDAADSTIKSEVFQDLTKRRNELDVREKKLSEREALLEAAQKELDKKFTEMEGVRDELKDLLKQQTTEEAMRIQSLVKIYSGMKPKDAARIFNTLDTDILMDVISGMTESKAGPIIALMDADRAKALTTLLAEQKKLPEMP